MYERMLNKQEVPTPADMASYCGETAELFTQLNGWLSENFETAQKITFPYGNQYGWGIAHRRKKSLVCNIFAEKNAFTVMMRLSNAQFELEYDNVKKYAQEYINHKYPCSDGGWIHYRVTCKEHLDDIRRLLSVKCST